jgi:hypothetical protein
MTPRRQSAVDGGPPLGLGVPGLLVDGLAYHEIKRRLGLIKPSDPGETTAEQRCFVGVMPRTPDRGWREASAWTLSLLKRDEAYEAQVRGIRWLIDLSDGHDRHELTA